MGTGKLLAMGMIIVCRVVMFSWCICVNCTLDIHALDQLDCNAILRFEALFGPVDPGGSFSLY